MIGQPGPGRAYAGTYRGLSGGRALVDTRLFGIVRAEQRLNYPPAVGRQALVAFRDRRWYLLGIF